MKKRYLVAGCFAAAISISVNAAELSVSEKGLGAISENTSFDKRTLQDLLPGYSVKADKDYTEGEEFPIFVVKDRGGVPLATINPSEDQKKIFSIRIKSRKIRNILGPTIGMKYGSIYGAVVHKSCSPGIEEMSGTVICNDPRSEHIAYVFEGSHDSPDGEIPDISVLKRFVISEIVWRRAD